MRIAIAVVAALCAAFCFALGSLVQQGAARQTHARAAATAVIYALVDAVTKSSVDLLTTRGAGVLATWEPYALAAAGILGGLFGQSAFNAGPLSLSLPVIDTLEPVCAVILAAAVFGEHLARSPGLLAFQLLGGGVATAGIVLLSHSPVVLTEERRESRSVEPPGSQPPHIEGVAEEKAGPRRQAPPSIR